VSKASLSHLHALAEAYGGRPSAYAGLTDPLAAFWLDEAALVLASRAQAQAAPRPPDPLAQLMRRSR
jgi:hypothetical protein